MFLSYQYIKYLGYNEKTKEYRWRYKITDSDFEEVGVGNMVWEVVINTYEKRKLNVPANLIKAFVWYGKKYSYPIAEVITWNKKYNIKFVKYEKDIEKYLSLL